MDRSQYPIVRKPLHDPDDTGYVEGTPEERVAMVWELTRAAWSFVDGFDPDQPMQRHIARFRHRKDDSSD